MSMYSGVHCFVYLFIIMIIEPFLYSVSEMIYRQQGMIPVSYVLVDNGGPSHKTEWVQQPQFGFLSTMSLFLNETVVY